MECEKMKYEALEIFGDPLSEADLSHIGYHL